MSHSATHQDRPRSLAAQGFDALAVLSVASDDLVGAVLAGGSGDDILQLTGGGTFDLTLPQTFASIEIVEGSGEHDTIILDEARFAGVTTIIGGTNPAQALDEIKLTGASFDLRGKTFTAVDRIALLTDDAVVTAADKATAMLLSGIDSQNDRLVFTGEALTAEDIRTLHRRGIDTVLDANGEHANAAPQTHDLDGARVRADAGQTVFLDAGRDSTVSDDDGPLTLLTVALAPVPGGSGRLGIDASGSVALASGYTAGSLVRVDDVEIGMIWSAGPTDLTIVFNANAAPERVQPLVRALTYTAPEGPPQATTLRSVSITVADEGGRKAVATVAVEQVVETKPGELVLSRDSVAELAGEGTLVGLITATIPGLGDAFTYELLNDAGGRFAVQDNRLVVKNGAALDYEQARFHAVTIRATAGDGQVVQRTFTIKIEDVAVEIVSGDTAPDTSRDDVLVGGRGRDRLNGDIGDDRLYGRTNRDTLTGGEGEDVFVFDTKPSRKNVDRVRDFKPKHDAFWFDNKVFKKLGKKGSESHPAKLNAKQFWKGKAAHDKSDRIVYDKKKGALYYDPDGTGSADAVLVAKLSKKLALTAKDFFVI